MSYEFIPFSNQSSSPPFLSLSFLSSFPTPFVPRSHVVQASLRTKDGLELLIFLHPLPEFQDDQHTPLYLVYREQGTEPSALCLLGKCISTEPHS